MKVIFAFAVALALAAPAHAQLGAYNQMGVRMGHIHLMVRDVDAQRDFWTSLMGGRLVQNGTLELIEFPDVYIILEEADDPLSNQDSILDHFGFIVKDFPAALARWQAAGIEIETTENPNLVHIFAPEGIDIEVYGEPALPTPAAMNHIHFYLPDIAQMKSWYVQTFGGNPGRRACVRCTYATPRMIETVDMPGTNLSLAPSERRQPTLGRAVDHISFDVEDLDAMVEALKARGVALDGPVQQLPGTTVQSVFLTDPWGTRIELTEGLAPR